MVNILSGASILSAINVVFILHRMININGSYALIHYGKPLKVTASLGISNESETSSSKLPALPNNVNSRVVYKAISASNEDIESILDAYWNRTYHNQNNQEYTSELPSRLKPYNNIYTQSHTDYHNQDNQEYTNELETNLKQPYGNTHKQP